MLGFVIFFWLCVRTFMLIFHFTLRVKSCTSFFKDGLRYFFACFLPIRSTDLCPLLAIRSKFGLRKNPRKFFRSLLCFEWLEDKQANNLFLGI